MNPRTTQDQTDSPDLHLAIRTIFASLFAVLALGACSSESADQRTQRTQQTQQTASAPPRITSDTFFVRHWDRPLEPQGEPPEHWQEVEKSLLPKDCGTCHQQQFADWSGSLHSKAMSPGLLGQLLEFDPADREAHQVCISCHTPLAEQADQLVDFLTNARNNNETAQVGLPETKQLFEQGMVCAACHYRNFTAYGPQRKADLPALPDELRKKLPHAGWEIREEYRDSRFCAGCHQFTEDQKRVNGKLLENTYNEWNESRYAKEGKTCQSCHMPDRQHLWRGIHDSATVAAGVDIQVHDIEQTNDSLSLRLVVTNSATGHNFPTYVTPKIHVEMYQQDSDGSTLTDSYINQTIGWDVSVSLTEEYADTRIAPDDSLAFIYGEPVDESSSELVLRIWVEPDAFYTAFYEALLLGGYTEYGTELIEQALAESHATTYTLFERHINLNE